MPGPSSRPITKYANVDTSSEPTRKWTTTNIKASLTTEAKDGVYASDHAKDVSKRKNDSR